MRFPEEDLIAARLITQYDKRDGLYGAFRGVVESIDDPDRLGRVQTRVWALHGNDQRTPSYALPWAEIAEHGGGGFDFGPFKVPPVGSSVWCLFEGGYADYPVVVGTFRGAPLRDDDNANVFLTKDGKPITEKPWIPPDGELETPKEVFEDVFAGDPHPTVSVWEKSYKGHTILVEDGNGKEFLRIIDRAGQMLEMSCPVTAELQEGNKVQRGTRNAIRGDQLPHEVIRDRKATVRLMDLSGQEVYLDSHEMDEKVYVRSKSRATGSQQVLMMQSGKGKELIELRDSSGSRMRFNPNSDISVSIEDNTGNAIYFDKVAGKVILKSAKGSEESVKEKTVTVEGINTKTVKGDDLSEVFGNAKATVSGDLSVGVMGNIGISTGLGMKIVVANASVVPPVNTTPLEVVVGPQGGMKVNVVNGDIDIGTTAAGDITISTTLLGKVVVRSAADDARLDGKTVSIGGPGAMEPLVLGAQWKQIMLDIIAALMAHNHLTGVGPSAPMGPLGTPELTAAQAKIQADLQLSNFCFTEKLRSYI